MADDFVFGGWYKDQLCTTPWNFNTDTVTQNVTIYAKWTDLTPDSYVYTCKVLDMAALNAPLKGATVSFRGETIITDDSGQVVFEDIPYGVYRISIECDGYKTITESITVEGDAVHNFMIRKMFTVNLAVTEGGVLYDKTGQPAPDTAEIPYGAMVSATINNPYKNTDPTLTFTDPDDGSTINFYTRRTSDLYRFKTWRIPMFMVTESGNTIVAEWEIDAALLRSLTATDRASQQEIRYLPVCDEDHPIYSEIVFFDEDGNIIPKSGTDVKAYTMSDLTGAYYYFTPYSTPFTAVRVIGGFAYDDVYGRGGSGPKEVIGEWKDYALWEGENVEALTTDSDPERIPQIADVGLDQIFKAYEGVNEIDRNGRFISCVAASEEMFYCYDAGEMSDRPWWQFDRGDPWNCDVVLSKVFH